MKLSTDDERILDHLQRAADKHPDLEALFFFYQRLFRLQFAFKARLIEQGPPTIAADPETLLQRLASGIPLLEFDDLPIETAPLIDFYREVVALLIRETGYARPDGGEPDPGTIVAAAREIFQLRIPLVGADPSTDAVRTASGLVLAPYLQRAREQLRPLVAGGSWLYGYCPICGGPPSFAVLQAEPALRTLFCSRCNAEWAFRRLGCPFCMERDHQIYYPGDGGEYRLQVCEACRRYVKTVERRESATERPLPVEAIATVAMDIAAREKGYLFF